MSAVLASTSVGLPPPKPRELITYVSRFSWHETVIRLSVLASVLANRGGPTGSLARELTVDLLAKSDPARMTPRGRTLWTHIQRLSEIPPIANESSIYFLQALALLYCPDEGAAPSDGAISEMLLVANDYGFEWREPDDPPLSRRARSVADTTRALGFNIGQDPARQIVRSYEMMRWRPERRSEWATDAEWQAFQERAFGMPFDEYFETLALPLVTLSNNWGSSSAAGIQAPILDPASFWEETRVNSTAGAEFLRALSVSRDDARRELEKQKRPDGMVVGPTLFYRTPFVELPDGRIVATSPPMVWEHLRGGLWGRHRNAMTKTAEWPPTFGELFEEWCQHVARLASEASADEIIIPDERGTDDEIEDVVIRKNRAAIFVSVKASTIPEAKMRGARSRASVVEWFDEFLFSTKGRRGDGQKHGGGAVRRLHAKVDKLRDGGYENRGLPRDLKVFPMVVSYEQGLDSPALYAWCEERCREEGLLTQARVHPITFAGVGDFEGLVALTTRGQSAVDILRQKTGERWKHGRFNVLLHERKKSDLELRLPALTELFDEISTRSMRTVFGREPATRGEREPEEDGDAD